MNIPIKNTKKYKHLHIKPRATLSDKLDLIHQSQLDK